MTERIKPPTAHPCASCPYRVDVPAGVWAEEEYHKLPGYDRETMHQPPVVFLCHQRNGHICSGWAGCHDMGQSLGVRFAVMSGALTGDDIDALFDYESPVRLFGSGAEAAEHGLSGVDSPDDRAVEAIGKLKRRRNLRGAR
jgi:hypothetical protein